MELLERAMALYDDTVALRRWFHMWPECQPAEQVQTMQRIEQELEALGIPYERIPGGGILGTIQGSKPGLTLLMRADLDALPIQEDPDNLAGPRVCISQRPGVMHACGHDAHMAMLLTEARMLKEMAPGLAGRVLLLFEEGEEGGGNIITICRWMQARQVHIDSVFACHVRWDLDSGLVGYTGGAAMSGLIHFGLQIQGREAHGSRPDEGHNVIDCFAQYCVALQGARMTCVVPDTCLTYSICKVQAGTVHNILPDRLSAEGTLRFTDIGQCRRFLQQMDTVAAACGQMTGCTMKVNILERHYPVISDNACIAMLRKAAQKTVGMEHAGQVPMWMASQSFSYLTSMYPGVMAFLGVKNARVGSGAGHHTAQFDIDEKALPYGVAAAVAYARDFLTEQPSFEGFKPAAPDLESFIHMMTD